MKILFVINSLIFAGAEALTKDLARELRKRGVECSVYVCKLWRNEFEQSLESAGVAVLESGPQFIYSPHHMLAVRRELKRCDAVISLLFPASLWTALAAGRGEGRPALITSEQSTYNRRRALPFGRALDGWMYAPYDAIACASGAIQQSLTQWLPAVTPRTTVIYNAIDLQRFESAGPISRKELGIPEEAPLLIFTARFYPQKDHACILRALAQVPGAHLLLAGDGPTRPAIQAMARKLGLEARVRFLGRRADVPELLKTADVYVHASHFEGFGIAAVEAMTAGLPVVAGDVPGLAEVVGGAGLLAPAGDAAAMARAIRSLLESPALKSATARACRERAQRFSIVQCADAYLQLCRRVLKERGR